MSQDAAAPPVLVSAVLARRDHTAVLTASSVSRRLRLRRAAVLAVLALAVFALVDTLTRGAPTRAGMLTGAVLAAFYAAFVLAGPWLVGGRTRRRAGVGVVVRWTFTPEGVTVRSVHSEDEFGWERVEDLCRTPRVVALVLRPGHGAMGFPAAAVDDAGFARIEQWWRAAGDGAAAAPAGPADGAPDDADSWGGPAWVDEVVLTGPMTLPVVRRLNLATLPSAVKVVWAVVVALCGLPLLVQVLSDPPQVDAGTLVVLVAALVVVPGLYELAVRRAAKRLGGGPTTWRATPEGLTMRTPLGRTSVPWARVETARDSRGLLVLLTARPRCALGMPTAGLADDDRARVREWLAAGTGGRVVLPARTPGG